MSCKIDVDGPIVVYQMGKVGSASVYESLRGLGLDVPVFHVHILNNIDKLASTAKDRYADSTAPLAEFENARRVHEALMEDPERPWNVISLIRDPLRQALSAFFHGLPWHLPDIQQRWEDGKFDVDEITKLFLTKHNHGSAVQWFDNQLRDVFHIDVYSRQFPVRRGYDILHDGRVSLLMLRLEDLNTCANKAFDEFLGLPDMELVKVNQAAQKWYADMYRQFLSEVALPAAYVDSMYSSKVSTHFYRPEELEVFRSQWAQSQDPWP